MNHNDDRLPLPLTMLNATQNHPSIRDTQVTYPDALVLMEHLQGMGESSAVLTRRAHVSRETFLAATAIYQELYGEKDGSIPATFQVVYMIGWAPHASQPLPKRRGSAQMSMKTLGKGH